MTQRQLQTVLGCVLKMCLLSCRYKGQLGASIIVGGVDCRGPHLYTVYPHGSTDTLPFVSMGEDGLFTSRVTVRDSGTAAYRHRPTVGMTQTVTETHRLRSGETEAQMKQCHGHGGGAQILTER